MEREYKKWSENNWYYGQRTNIQDDSYGFTLLADEDFAPGACKGITPP